MQYLPHVLVLALIVALAAALGIQSARGADVCNPVLASTSTNITGIDGVCKAITNNAADTVCTFAESTTAEWQSFYNSPPSNVTVTMCCAGYIYGGYCYYLGLANACATRCAGQGHGTCDPTGLNYIGNGDPTGANCSTVASAVIGSSLTATALSESTSPYEYLGCVYDSSKSTALMDLYGATTSCTASLTGYVRICACTQ